MSSLKTTYGAYEATVELADRKSANHIIVVILGPVIKYFDYTDKKWIRSIYIERIVRQVPIPRNIKTALLLVDY